jgi:hypothetical protein
MSARLRQVASRDAIALFAISFVGLYLELVAIRWIPTQVRLLAYFSNFVLVACLLGLGLGMILDRRGVRLLRLFAAGLVLLVGAVLVLGATDFRLPLISGDTWFWNTGTQAASQLEAYAILIPFVLLIALVFVPLGQEIGIRLRAFPPVTAYSINIAGSLAGVLAFAVVSYVELGPPWWFGLGLAALLAYHVLTGDRLADLAVAASLFAGVVAVIFAYGVADGRGQRNLWSPYYRVQVSPIPESSPLTGYNVRVNRDSHQQALDLAVRPGEVERIGVRRSIYDLPYKFGSPQRVLVVGAGTGNDVAAALRANPRAQIDAVEIDPRIAQLGRELHPEQPYANRNVTIHIDDARAYLQRSTQKYDAIVFGFLDSHRLFSHMSSVRLDNYVYTKQSLESVRERLNPGGVVALTFTVHEKWIADRLYGLVGAAFGHRPLVYDGGQGTGGTMFINSPRGTPAAPAGWPRVSLADVESRILGRGGRETWNYVPNLSGFVDDRAFDRNVKLPTDEWPYLYMREASVPPSYLQVLLLTLAAAIALVWLVAPRPDFRKPSTWNFFALGAAFALLETRGITDIGLVLGSTWVTNAVVISAILIMILLANLIVLRVPRLPLRAAYAALFAVLIFNYFVSLRAVLDLSYPLAVLAASVQVGLPLLLSGIIFARSFARAEDAGAALGANLMGAVVGALLEYSSLRFGLRELYLGALAFYVVSYLIVNRPRVGALPTLARQGAD